MARGVAGKHRLPCEHSLLTPGGGAETDLDCPDKTGFGLRGYSFARTQPIHIFFSLFSG